MELQKMPEAKPLSAQYVRDEDWLDAHLSELVEQYPDKWVAVVNERVAAIGEDMGEGRRKAKEQFPDAEPVVWLLEGTIRVYSACFPLS